MMQPKDEQSSDVKSMGVTFKLVNNVKEIPLHPEYTDGRVVLIGSSLPPK